MTLHSRTVATYYIFGERFHVELCWQGTNPDKDPDRFYEIYARSGANSICLTLGDPWHDDGSGVPTYEDVASYATNHPSLFVTPVENHTNAAQGSPDEKHSQDTRIDS
jgi:hypothetical protein